MTPVSTRHNPSSMRKSRVSTTDTPRFLRVWRSADRTWPWEHGRGFISRCSDKDAHLQEARPKMCLGCLFVLGGGEDGRIATQPLCNVISILEQPDSQLPVEKGGSFSSNHRLKQSVLSDRVIFIFRNPRACPTTGRGGEKERKPGRKMKCKAHCDAAKMPPKSSCVSAPRTVEMVGHSRTAQRPRPGFPFANLRRHSGLTSFTPDLTTRCERVGISAIVSSIFFLWPTGLQFSRLGAIDIANSFIFR